MDYPWYEIVRGDEIEQGDIIENCPVFILPDDLSTTLSDIQNMEEVDFDLRDVIVMSQSCDLVKGRGSISKVLLCSLWDNEIILEQKKSKIKASEWWENVRKGRMPRFHILNEYKGVGLEKEFRAVDFGETYTLPLGYFRTVANQGDRLRLLPPYREHLSQAFARFFMRVGLPVDIPPFK